jgi:hypothetical protein
VTTLSHQTRGSAHGYKICDNDVTKMKRIFIKNLSQICNMT